MTTSIIWLLSLDPDSPFTSALFWLLMNVIMIQLDGTAAHMKDIDNLANAFEGLMLNSDVEVYQKISGERTFSWILLTEVKHGCEAIIWGQK